MRTFSTLADIGLRVAIKSARKYRGGHMRARVAWIDEPESNYSGVVILDLSSGDALEIQRAHTYSDEDRRLGHDTYCLVRNGASHYGGIQSYTLSGQNLQISLSRSAAHMLDLPTSLDIDVDDRGSAVLEQRMPELLDEC